MKLFWGKFGIYGSVAVFVFFLIVAMLASDYYYSKMEREYPLLTRLDSLDGVITDFVIHHNYTYIQVDSTVQRMIRPTLNNQHQSEHFHKLINLEDSIMKEAGSKGILVIADGKSYAFELNENY